MRISLSFLPSLLLLAMTSLPALSATELTGADALRQKFGLTQYSGAGLASLKIAILDNGFEGYTPGTGQLPVTAELIPGPQNGQAPTEHGLGMAEIVWAMTGKAAAGPKFYLLNTNGFTNFKSAVDFVVRERVDIVLYSQVWSFGSNFDGTGFINAAVNRATRAGVMWINAAGNFGGMVYNGTITRQVDRTTRLLMFNGKDSLTFDNKIDENPVSLTLSWTDFRETENYNTDKDLDFYVYDANEKLIGSGELVQRGEAPPATGSSPLSSYARETISLPRLDRGTYRIRVRMKSEGFVESDRFRISLQNEKPGSVIFTDRTAGNEIFAPADNPTVITVGEAFEASSVGPTSDGRVKPDVLIGDSIVSFSNGSTVRGSSSAAALFAGTVAVMKGARPDLSTANLMNYLRGLQAQVGSRDGLTPASSTAWPPLPSEVTALVPIGGRLMIHPNGHFVVLSPVDPLSLPWFQTAHAYRQRPDDILLANLADRRWQAIPLAQGSWVQSPWIEFRLAGETSGIWRTPTPIELRGL